MNSNSEGRNVLVKFKETRKGRKKGFIALCLAVAMAFSYNVPAFAKEYVVNPDCNKDNRQDNPNVGEYEKGAVIWAGDDSFVLNYFNPDDNSYEFINDLTYNFIIDDKQVNWTPVNGATEKTTNEVPLIYSQGDKYGIMLSNDNNYNDCYSEDGTIRAWELDSIVSGASSSGNCKRSFTITLKALTTSKVILHFVGETDDDSYSFDDLYYVEGKEKNISIKSVVEELGLENKLPELLDYDGWYNNPDFDGDTIASIPSNASGKVELYAKPSTHKITYETNGGKFATGYEQQFRQEPRVTRPSTQSMRQLDTI